MKLYRIISSGNDIVRSWNYYNLTLEGCLLEYHRHYDLPAIIDIVYGHTDYCLCHKDKARGF